jgi:hypothetical protein
VWWSRERKSPARWRGFGQIAKSPADGWAFGVVSHNAQDRHDGINFAHPLIDVNKQSRDLFDEQAFLLQDISRMSQRLINQIVSRLMD